MDEDTLALLSCNFDEIENVFRSLVLLVKEDLAFIVLPEEGQVNYAKSFPLVLQLLASAVYHTRYFVHLYEIQVLDQTEKT